MGCRRSRERRRSRSGTSSSTEPGCPPFIRFFLEFEGKEAFKEAIGELPLDYTPGDSTVYSDIGLMTVAFIVEEITGTPIWMTSFKDQGLGTSWECRTRVFSPDPVPPSPHRSHGGGYHLPVHPRPRRGSRRERIRHRRRGRPRGLFSSARDMAVLAQTLLNGGASRAVPERRGPASLFRAPPGPGSDRCPHQRGALHPALRLRRLPRALGWDTPRRGVFQRGLLSRRGPSDTLDSPGPPSGSIPSWISSWCSSLPGPTPPGPTPSMCPCGGPSMMPWPGRSPIYR